MGNHRAERHDPRCSPSETPADQLSVTSYVGRRVAGRVSEPPAASAGLLDAATSATAATFASDLAAAQAPATTATSTPGKRRAVKHVGPRGRLVKGLPSVPVLLGVATLAAAVCGTLGAGAGAAPGAELANSPSQPRPATAMSSPSVVGPVDNLRSSTLSRGYDRRAAQQSTDPALVKAAEAQVAQRNAALGQLTAQVQKQAKKLNDDRWVVPLHPVVLTARFGDYGLWANMHTGLDFNGETGDPIHAIATGVVTFVGYDGSYGNKTVVTLPDGTELWYCHQTTQYVSVGDAITPDEIIGTVGTTGNVTGSHLHLEVRPGGGDPVDPYAAFVQHGLIPEQG